MIARTRSVALLAGNPAFAAILSRALEEDGDCRVGSFESAEALTTFLRIAPVDVVVLDCDLPGVVAADVAQTLRRHARLANTSFEIVALTRAAEAFHRPLFAAGVDAVLMKPIVPAQLVACIERLLDGESLPVAAPVHRGVDRPMSRRVMEARPVERQGNVIPLFGEGRAPR